MQTYFAPPARGFPGQTADTGVKDDISRTSEGVIPPGLVVVRGTNPDVQARLPEDGDTAERVLGVSVRSHIMADEEGYADGQVASIRRLGRIMVRCESAFDPSEPVFFRVKAGTGSQPGAVRTDDDTASAVAWPAAKFVNSGGAGDIAILSILSH